MKTCGCFLLGTISLLLASGCSSFNREWRDAASRAQPAGLAGRWEGRWRSQANGHNDALRALATQVDANHCDVKFRAEYKKWITFHFGYTVRMETTSDENGTIAFHGSEDLGTMAGGVYTYEGRATATNFFSNYKSKYDYGTFEMKRPKD